MPSPIGPSGRTASFFDTRDRNDPEYDSEAIYFDLLRDIGRTVDLRVIVDILAGASAGGINSVMLARALSHDLPMGRLRDLWLNNADVTELLAPEAKAHRFSKWLLRPCVLGRRPGQVQTISATPRCAPNCRCSCARAGSSHRSAEQRWPR